VLKFEPESDWEAVPLEARELVKGMIEPVPENRQRGMFMAVGGVDNTIRVLSLERERPLKQLSAQALQSPAVACAMAFCASWASLIVTSFVAFSFWRCSFLSLASLLSTSDRPPW